MKKTSKAKPTFATMPKEYEDLCKLLLPRPIHDKAAYENTTEIAEVFAGWEEAMSPGQADYFEILCDMIAKYDSEQDEPIPDASPLELLKLLMEEHNMSGADLSKLLGASRLLGPMILRGERSITAKHAAVFGEHFAVSPAAFIAKGKKH